MKKIILKFRAITALLTFTVAVLLGSLQMSTAQVIDPPETCYFNLTQCCNPDGGWAVCGDCTGCE